MNEKDHDNEVRDLNHFYMLLCYWVRKQKAPAYRVRAAMRMFIEFSEKEEGKIK